MKLVGKFWPVVLILILLAVVFHPFFRGDSLVANGIGYSDLWQFNYPLKDWYRSKLVTGQFPFWTSLLGNGFPVFAEGQIGALYPWHLLLFRIFPTTTAFNSNVFLHYFIAWFGTYLFARLSLKVSRWAALLAGMGYALSGYFFTHVLFFNTVIVVSYLPLVFLAIEKICSRKKVYWSLVLGILFSLQILGGYIELFYYVLLAGSAFLLALVIFKPESEASEKRIQLKPIGLFILALGIAVLITLVQLVPTLELVGLSNRAGGFDISYASSSRWPARALTMFVNPKAYERLSQEGYHLLDKNFVSFYSLYGYLGLATLLLAATAIVLVRKRLVLIFSFLLILAFIYGAGRSTQIFNILWEIIPGIKSLRFPVKILFLIEFCLAVLAAYGFDYWILRMKGFGKNRLASLVSAAAVAVVIVNFVDVYLNNAGRFRKVLDTQEWLRPPEAVQILKQEIDGGNNRYYSTNTNNLHQDEFDLAMQKEYQNLVPVNFNMLFGLPSSREYFALFLQDHTDLNNFRGSVNFETNTLSFPDEFFRSLKLQSVNYLLSDLPIVSEEIELIGKIPFSKEGKHSVHLAGEELKTVYLPVEGVNIYKLEAYPRINFVGKAELISDKQEALKKVLAEDFDPTKSVVLSDGVPETKLSENPVYKVKAVEDSEDLLAIKIENEQDGILVVSDTYYPGWRVSVDGKEAKLLRANFDFKAVELGEGSHEVVFKFRQTHWREIALVSTTVLLVTIVGLVITLKLGV